VAKKKVVVKRVDAAASGSGDRKSKPLVVKRGGMSVNKVNQRR
jgi:hypothetical protein